MPVLRPPNRMYPLALIAVVTTWALYMTLAQKWGLFVDYWMASVTMVFGSFIAGSTPAGGGAVAFPVFTKILGVATDTARTHALMIQAVGMSMASLFILSRGIPYYHRVVKWACLGGVVGMVWGTLFLRLPDPYPKVLFTSVVLAFGIKFAITHLFLRLPTRAELPADWGTRSKDVVEQIGIPFAPIAGGSEGAMIAEIKAAVAAEDPVLVMFWQPHWLFAENDMNWVEWDAADGECVEESGQAKGNACGFQQASISKIANKGFSEAYPGANAIYEAYSIGNDVQNAMMLEIDQKGRDLEEVVAEWVDANEATWAPWVAAGEAAKN